MTVRTGDVVDVLLVQHGEIENALDDVLRVEMEGRAAAFDRLRDLLLAHEEAEQRVIHPVLRQQGGDEVAEARLDEEHAAKAILVELESRLVDEPGWEEQFSELRTAVLDHARHELDTEFAWLRENLTVEELYRLADEVLSVQAMH